MRKKNNIVDKRKENSLSGGKVKVESESKICELDVFSYTKKLKKKVKVNK